MNGVKTIEELHSDLIKRQQNNTTSEPDLGELSAKKRNQGSVDLSSFSPYSSNDVYKTLNDGSRVAMFANTMPGTDNNERLAQSQSGWEQTINGLEKAGANIGSVVLGNTAGFVYGLADWAKTGNFSSVYDNSFSQTLDDWNTKLNYQLPNYYTKQEQEAGFFESMGSANFWANDVANGLSFTFGTIASEAIWAYATGGASLATKLGQLGAKTGKFGKAILGSEKVAEGLATHKGMIYKALDNAVATGKLNKGLANTLAKTGEVINTARFIGTSSGNEAGIEAFHFKKEATENFYRNFEELNGRPPTTEETAEMLEKIEGAANNVFASNMAILGVSNLAMLGNLFNLKSPISTLQKNANQKLFGIGVKKTAGETGELVFKGIERKAWQKGAGLLYKGTSPIAREGLFEEGLQGVATKTANNWIERQYDPKYLNKVMSLSDDAWKAMQEQYGTKEGWKEIGIGGIVGIAGGVVTGEFSQFSRMAKEQEDIVSKGLNAANATMNTFVSDINAGRMITMAKVMEAEDRVEQAMAKKDVVAAKLAQNESMIALAEMYNNPLYGAGGLEQMERHGNNMIETTEVSAEEKEVLKAGYKEFINEYKSANTFANSIVGNQGRIYGTNFQAANVQKALTYTILQGQSSKKIMDESLGDLQSLMNSELIEAVKRNDDLEALGSDKKRQVKNLSQRYRDWEKKSETVQKQVRLLQAAPVETQGNKQSRLIEMQQKLVEIEDSKQEIRAELETIGREIAQNKKMQQSFGQDVSTIPMVDDFIAVDDLINLEKKLEELESSYNLLKQVNPISAQAVEEHMSNYKKAQKSLLDYNTAVKLIASGNFKPRLADTNPFSGIFKKFSNGEENSNQYTSDFLVRLNEIKNSYNNAVMEVGQIKTVEDARKILADLEAVEELTEEQQSIKAQAEKLISDLEVAPTETVNNDTPSKESKAAQKVEELLENLETLEEELKNTPENVTVEGIQTDTEAKKADIEREGNKGVSNIVKTKLPDSNFQVLEDETIRRLDLISDAKNIDGHGILRVPNGETQLSVLLKILDSQKILGDWGKLSRDYSQPYSQQMSAWLSAPFIVVGLPNIPLADKNNNNELNPYSIILNGWGEGYYDILLNYYPNVNFIKGSTITEEQLLAAKSNVKQQSNPRVKEIKKQIGEIKKQISSLQPQKELSPVEALRARIEDILKLFKTSFVGTYDIDEALKNKPDKKDIERYRELKQDRLIQEYESTGQVSIDVEEFEALKEKLSQWRVYDSLAENNESIADLLDLVALLETEVEQQDTVAESNMDDIFTSEPLKPTATIDVYELSVNTNYPVTVKRENSGNYSVTHMNPSSLLQRMGATNVTIGKSKKEVSFKEVDDQKKQGMKVNFISGGVPMYFEVKERGRIEVAEKIFQAIPNVKTINSLTSWTYPTLYEQDFEGNWRAISSDFSDDKITGDTNKLKEGDAVELFVDVNNEYNQKLIAQGLKGVDLANQAVVYIRKNGENFGTVKGIPNRENLIQATDKAIINLRDLAGKALEEGKSGVIATTKVKYVQLGNPVVSIDGNGAISQIAISDSGVKNIKATGFIQDGEFTLNKKIDNVRRSFIKKTTEKNKGKKVPVVIIERASQMIAFPIHLVKRNVSKVDELSAVLSDDLKTDAQKVTAINEVLVRNGVSPSDYNLTTWDEQKIAAIEARLESNEEFLTAEQLASENYAIANLVNDATISLDLKNLNVSLPSQKFNIDLENLDYENLPNLKVEKQEVLEKEAEKEVETPKVISAKKQVNKPKTPIKKETFPSEAVADAEEIAETIVSKIVEEKETIPSQTNLISFDAIDYGGNSVTYYKKGSKWGYLNSNGVFDSLIPNAQIQIEAAYQSAKEMAKTQKESEC